jgi:hypothetical protein
VTLMPFFFANGLGLTGVAGAGVELARPLEPLDGIFLF